MKQKKVKKMKILNFVMPANTCLHIASLYLTDST